MQNDNSRENQLQRRLELVWWLFTAVLVLAILSPIYINKVQYAYYGTNAAFIVPFVVTLSRYISLLKYTRLARQFWLKIGIVAVSLIALFVCATALIDFNNYVEEAGLQEMVAELPARKQYPLIRYIQKEVIFFGVGSILALIVFPIRMLISIWRMKNTLTNV